MQTIGHASQSTRLNLVEYEIGVRGIRDPKGGPMGPWLVGKKTTKAHIKKDVLDRCGPNPALIDGSVG